MSGNYTQLYIHIIWATWDRLPLIKSEFEERVYQAIAEKCRGLGCEMLAIGGIEDHIHLLVRFVPTISIAELVKAVKGSSSHLISNEISPGEFFRWQSGYSAFTLRKDDGKTVAAYILNQKQHHLENNLNHAWEPTSQQDD